MRFYRSVAAIVYCAIVGMTMFACGDQSARLSGLSWTKTAAMGLDEALGRIQEQSIKDNLYYLASKELEGRGNGQPGNAKAAEFIAGKFKEYGLRPTFGDSYLQTFTEDSYTTTNVIGVLPGNDAALKNEAIVVGAHFDHLGKNGNFIYYGADDNASGTAAIIEAVKAAAAVRDYFKRTVIFIAFSAEEEGLVGSYYYVEHSLSQYKSVYMINLDMVGYLRNKNLYFEGGSSNAVYETIIQNICKKYPTISPNLSADASGGSDHMPFLRRGIPVVWLFTGDESYYHTPGDTPNRINYPGLTDISKVMFEVLWNVMMSETLPPPVPHDDTYDENDVRFTHDHGGARFPSASSMTL